MNRIILIIIVLTLSTFKSNAQGGITDVRDKFMFGLKVGINYSNVYDSKGEKFNSDPKIGIASGMFLAIPIGKYIGIQPELMISQRGFRATGNILGSPYTITRTTNYIDVPLLFSFKPSEFLTLTAGPQYSYLISQRNVFANATTTILQEQEFENENIRKNTLSFIGGLELTLKHFVFGARVAMDAQNNNGDGTSKTPRYKNIWFQTIVGYRFYRQ